MKSIENSISNAVMFCSKMHHQLVLKYAETELSV